MGHLVNAKGFRVGVNKFWDSKLINTRNYFYFNNVFYFLNYYLENFFNVKRFKLNSFVYSHFVCKNYHTYLGVDIYLFGGYFDVLNLLSLKNRKNKRALVNLAKEFYLKKFIRYCQNFVFNIIKKRLLIDFTFINIAKIRLFAYSEANLTPEILGRLISIKLENLYSLNQIINPIIKDFTNKRIGININCAGRFTRKQRAHFVRFKFGSVPYSTITKSIGYFFIPVRLKYGACGIKLWISK